MVTKKKSKDKGKIKSAKEELPKRLSRTPAKEEGEQGSGEKAEPEVLKDAGQNSEGDYLQKYQYGRELPLGDPRTNPQGGGKAEKMKNSLLQQPKIRILIPVESGSDPSVPASVTLNGYRLDLPRNVYLDVPEQVAEIVMKSQKQTNEALAQFRIKEEE